MAPRPPRMPSGHVQFQADTRADSRALDNTESLAEQAQMAALDAAEVADLRQRAGLRQLSGLDVGAVEKEAVNPLTVGFDLVSLETFGRSACSGGPRAHHVESGEPHSSPINAGSASKPDVVLSAKSSPQQCKTTSGNWQRRPRNRQGCSDEVRSRERRRLEEVVKSCGLLLAPDPKAPNREVLRAAEVQPIRRSCREQRTATHRLVEGLSVSHKGSRDTLRTPSSCGGSAARLLRAQQQQGFEGPSCDGEPPSLSHRQRPRSASSSRPDNCRFGCAPSVSRSQRPHSAGSCGAMFSSAPTSSLPSSTDARLSRQQGPLSGGCGFTGHRAEVGQASVAVPSATENSPNVHELPAAQTAAILRAALGGRLPVHLTHTPASATQKHSSEFKEGGPPPAYLQAEILAAALRGEIPVRSISTQGSKSWNADAARAQALSTSAGVTEISNSRGSSVRSNSDDGLGKLFGDDIFGTGLHGQMSLAEGWKGFGNFSEPSSSEREFELEQPDWELAPRCEVDDRSRRPW